MRGWRSAMPARTRVLHGAARPCWRAPVPRGTIPCAAGQIDRPAPRGACLRGWRAAAAVVALLAVAVTAAPAAAPTPPAATAPLPLALRRVDTSLALEAQAAIRRGCRYLVSRQLPDGSWAAHPAVTSLAALALLNAPGTTGAEMAPAGRRGALAVAEALPLQLATGPAAQRPYPVLTTAVASFVLVRLQDPAHDALLHQARTFLLQSQCLDLPADAPGRGGFAGVPGRNPELTTSEYVLEALYLTDFLDAPTATGADSAGNAAPARAAYAAALGFIGRCQELHPVEAAQTGAPTWRRTPGWFHDTPPGVADGGPPGAPRGVGYLTAAGLKSLLYAGSPESDPHVQAALGWFGTHFTAAENPELGQAGYYTYLFTVTKALHAWERRDPEGRAAAAPPGWRRAVLEALLSRQSGDGGWRCRAADWWENRPELATAYALLTLELALRE